MKLYFIRHGKTNGNREKRYVGRTDEVLCEEGITELLKVKDKLNHTIFKNTKDVTIVSSPLVRCKQTASTLFPRHEVIYLDNLKECDFGDYEGHTWEQLKDLKEYQQWIASGGKSGFPNGEDRDTFVKRCLEGFEEGLQCAKVGDDIVFVVHGGTIMAIMSALIEETDFYQFQLKNAQAFECEWIKSTLTVIRTIKGKNGKN